MPTALRTLRLRSSSAHSDRKPAVEVQQCPLRAEVGEELARRKWTWKLMQTWSRRNWRRRRRRRRRTTALIKSNNPHLAGGEQKLSSPSLQYSSSATTINIIDIIIVWCCLQFVAIVSCHSRKVTKFGNGPVAKLTVIPSTKFDYGKLGRHSATICCCKLFHCIMMMDCSVTCYHDQTYLNMRTANGCTRTRHALPMDPYHAGESPPSSTSMSPSRARIC